MKFKKIIAALTAAAIVGTGFMSFSAKAAELGDVNGDTSVDSFDATQILIYYANVLLGNNVSIDTSVSDVNADGTVDSSDATLILIYYANVLLGNNVTIADIVNNPQTGESSGSATQETQAPAAQSKVNFYNYNDLKWGKVLDGGNSLYFRFKFDKYTESSFKSFLSEVDYVAITLGIDFITLGNNVSTAIETRDNSTHYVYYDGGVLLWRITVKSGHYVIDEYLFTNN